MIDLLWGESPHRKAYHPTKWGDKPQETILGVFKLDFDSYESSRNFETGGSTQNFEPGLSSIAIRPGEPFWKKSKI